MESEKKEYDPRSFVSSYTQRETEGVPPDLQSIITGYIPVETWYESIRSQPDRIFLMPPSEFLSYVNELVTMGYTSQVDTLLDFYWRYPIPRNADPEHFDFSRYHLDRPKYTYTMAARYGLLPLLQHLAYVVTPKPSLLSRLRKAV